MLRVRCTTMACIALVTCMLDNQYHNWDESTNAPELDHVRLQFDNEDDVKDWNRFDSIECAHSDMNDPLALVFPLVIIKGFSCRTVTAKDMYSGNYPGIVVDIESDNDEVLAFIFNMFRRLADPGHTFSCKLSQEIGRESFTDEVGLDGDGSDYIESVDIIS